MNEDLLIHKIIKLAEDVADTKDKIMKVGLLDNLLLGQDKMIRLLERMDTERTFTNSRLDRLEADIDKIKLKLQMA